MENLLSFLKVNNWFEFWWVAFGLFGQLMFTGRFVIQWIASERAGRSTVPLAFWYFSIAGALILFTYAVYRQDPVFILGQSFGIVVYTRNLWLIRKEKQENDAT
ncbi:MAG: lipid-A-disaccharide synthase N-terminal domain-containing protein [Shimia sp.]|jgi:lipid-A-disaccharide synthase-like uncharacterized protein|uniref:lipid-A-disaccharide synthase N-terminal domain-containing protein n=1 Tax=Shimia sp. TaxID=1954381 RepID=UPI00405884D2